MPTIEHQLTLTIRQVDPWSIQLSSCDDASLAGQTNDLQGTDSKRNWSMSKQKKDKINLKYLSNF